MGVGHSNLIAEILIALSRKPNVRAWKNETGMAFRGDAPIRFGLKGSADILGIIGPSGRFLAIECKVGKDKQREEQKNFEAMITKLGGLYILARSAEDVKI